MLLFSYQNVVKLSPLLFRFNFTRFQETAWSSEHETRPQWLVGLVYIVSSGISLRILQINSFHTINQLNKRALLK